MAASVNLPPAAPLPPRPDRVTHERDMADAEFARGSSLTAHRLAAEVLHLRAELEAKGGELGGLMFHAQEVARVWLELHPTQRADVSPDLADVLDELAELAGVSL